MKKTKNSPMRLFLGFDGFIDEIKKVVSENGQHVESKSEFVAMLGEEHINKDLDLDTTFVRAGGSCAITAKVCAGLGAAVTAYFNAGKPKINPLFLADGIDIHSLGQPAITWALEFHSGKVMLADRTPLEAVSLRNLPKKEEKALKKALWESDGVMLLGYAVVPRSLELWDSVRSILLKAPSGKRPRVFFDLADISVKSDAELEGLIAAIRGFAGDFPVTLSLNRNEANRMSRFCSTGGQDDLAEQGKALYAALGVEELLIHSSRRVVGCSKGIVSDQETEYVEKPVTTTGCGDNFSGAYFFHRCAGADMEKSIEKAKTAASYYIKTGRFIFEAEPGEM